MSRDGIDESINAPRSRGLYDREDNDENEDNEGYDYDESEEGHDDGDDEYNDDLKEIFSIMFSWRGYEFNKFKSDIDDYCRERRIKW